MMQMKMGVLLKRSNFSFFCSGLVFFLRHRYIYIYIYIYIYGYIYRCLKYFYTESTKKKKRKNGKCVFLFSFHLR